MDVCEDQRYREKHDQLPRSFSSRKERKREGKKSGRREGGREGRMDERNPFDREGGIQREKQP